MGAIVEVKHLKKYFPTPKGALHAVDDVSFKIEEGTTLGVVGESGCGKSTLGRTIIHLQDSTDGQILFDGEDITHVGIRGHWLRPASEPGENCMPVQVSEYMETTFEHQYMIDNKEEKASEGLWWMRPKNSFTEDPDQDLPEYLYFPPEHLMLLK